VVDKVVVPREWTFIRGGKATVEGPLYLYPSMSIAAQVLAVVSLGVARASLDCFGDMAGGRVSITGAPSLADRAYVQSDYAKAEADLRAARAFFYEATEEAFATLSAGSELAPAARALLRLASTKAARVGADIASAMYRLSGTSGIFAAHPIGSFMQDAIIPAQHAFLSDGTWENAGKVLLGRDVAPGFC
jgi:alkylation response protein AidB-like acyl-CoA dehydrogenase